MIDARVPYRALRPQAPDIRKPLKAGRFAINFVGQFELLDEALRSVPKYGRAAITGELITIPIAMPPGPIPARGTSGLAIERASEAGPIGRAEKRSKNRHRRTRFLQRSSPRHVKTVMINQSLTERCEIF